MKERQHCGKYNREMIALIIEKKQFKALPAESKISSFPYVSPALR